MKLFTFDIFGTVVDWRAGFGPEFDFDGEIDRQAGLAFENEWLRREAAKTG